MAAALLGCREPEPVVAEVAQEPEADPHAEARARLLALEDAQRGQLDFAAIPASDQRLGANPYRVLALDDRRFAGLLRGADQLVVFDEHGAVVHTAATPHDPTDLATRGRELLVVGTGEARVARYDATTLERLGDIALPGGLAPRAIAATPKAAWVADEGHGQLHRLEPGDDGELEVVARQPYCRGPIALHAEPDLLVGNCLLEHRIRVDRIMDGQLHALPGPQHDGPIWSFELGPADPVGDRLLALTGVEDHPLERRDGGFGYIDSFVFVYALRESGVERLTSVNVSELGVVTPKWSRWRINASDPTPTPALQLAGYATPDLLTLRWAQGFEAAPEVERWPGLPGTTDVARLGAEALWAADPLLDRWLHITADAVTSKPAPPDDRSFEERLGEALVFTTAMAPWNDATGKRSRFTCETCHFEGRGDGRVHFTGREFEGRPIHASSKPLIGLVPNRPHFSRALDRTTTKMIDNEFGVANRHSARAPWFALDVDALGWLAELPGWPAGGVDGETLRRALLRFLIRWSMPSNPATRGRAQFDPLEARGAQLFASTCEGCHQARLVADDPSTRVALGPGGDLEPWRRLIFSDNAPLVWASNAYAKTGIVPWVHPEGARVAALRRLYLKWPYFTNGGADSLEAVLEGVRLREDLERSCDHELGPATGDSRGLSDDQRAALLAFLRLL
ncbi:hypothetical protein DB30_00643 [Enhygromyxa salina]|uniref:Cytochrome c domain-containing protein n=1 Tax=Enhygromyxa salina TaxID=215803 RepID=A0A0C2A4P6_9BACT|nr:hypothetical protein [Enhygromyxa salina]KIG18358.1 hypothetical protein DB30_00643 [Enhygromyxa salina]